MGIKGRAEMKEKQILLHQNESRSGYRLQKIIAFKN